MTHHKKTHKKKRRAAMNAFAVIVTLLDGSNFTYPDVVTLDASASGGVIDIVCLNGAPYGVAMADIISAQIHIVRPEIAAPTEQAVTNLEAYDAA